MSESAEARPSEETVPYGMRRLVRLLHRNPTWKGPTTGAVVLFLALLFGGGFLYISETHANDGLRKVHNVSACTIRSYLEGVRKRQVLTAEDTTQSPSSRKRARQSLPGIDTLISSQVTSPENFNCEALLKQLAERRPQVHTK